MTGFCGYCQGGRVNAHTERHFGEKRKRKHDSNVILQQAIEQQTHFAHFAAVVEALDRRHVDR